MKTGIIGSMVVGAKTGNERRKAANEIFKVFKGNKDEGSIEDFVEVANKMNEAPQIESFNKWSESYDKYKEAYKKVPGYDNIKSDLVATVMASKEEGVAGMFGVFTQSMVSMLNSEAVGQGLDYGLVGSLGGIAAGAAGGPLAPVTSTAGGIGGGVSGFMMGASKMTEQLATFTDLVQEEIRDNPQKYKGGFNEENVGVVLNDEDLFKKFKRRSISRGFTIGAIDAAGAVFGIKGASLISASTRKAAGPDCIKISGGEQLLERLKRDLLLQGN
jgi:hypothetical protein